MASTNVPALNSDSGLSRYLQEIQKFPLLEKDEEYMLAQRLKEHGDQEAAEKLITSHLRLVAKIAMGYRGYGLSIAEIVSEGNIGLMQAVKKFEPEKGSRLATYAIWWIRASIQEYVLKSWSLVKMGTSVAHKRLFFNLRRLKSKLGAYDDKDLSPETLQEIARTLDVSEDDVLAMNSRMVGGDHSLNGRMGFDGDDEWIDVLASGDISQEAELADSQEYAQRSVALASALGELKDRERDIIVQRRLTEPAITLEELSQKYGVSRERVRQIEVRAMEKLQGAMLTEDTPHAA